MKKPKKRLEDLRSFRWFGPQDLRSFGHRSRMLQMGYDAADFAGKPVIALVFAVGLGMAGIVFALPFQRAAAEFRQHYYNGGVVGIRAISQAYRSLFVDYTHTSLTTQRVAAILFVLCALAPFTNQHHQR